MFFCSIIFCVPLGKRLMTIFLLLKLGHPRKMHCQFSKLLGNYYSYMTEEIKWWVSEYYTRVSLQTLLLFFVNHIAMILYVIQRFEKLCRAILASMEVENEPKVSLWMFDMFKGTFPYKLLLLHLFIRHGMFPWLSQKTSPFLGSNKLKMYYGLAVSSWNL